MNRDVTLTKRENEIAEGIAWGGAYKDIAALLHISVRTVDNTLRKIKVKIGANKINEIATWWFCTHHDISFDLSPFARRCIAMALLCIVIGGEVIFLSNSSYTSHRSNKLRTEHRTKRQETSINQPYII